METCPFELLDVITDILFDDDPEAWWAFALTCHSHVERYVEPRRQQCEKLADDLLDEVMTIAEKCYPDYMVQAFDDSHWERHQRRDGVYRYTDDSICHVWPDGPHRHSASVRYTRFGRGLDIWECELDSHTWKIIG